MTTTPPPPNNSEGRRRPIIGRRRQKQKQRATSKGGGAPRMQPRYTAPRVAPDALRRERLLDFLHESSQHRLILVAAAAGYGKSSLLAAFAAECVNPVAWLRVSEEDRDAAALASHMAGALEARFPGWRSSIPSLAGQVGITPTDLGRALAHEMGARRDDYYLLILDDFHLAADEPAALTLINTLLRELPEPAHLLIAGRTMPPLDYAALVARQQMTGLDEERLRFTADEVQALLRVRNQLDVPREAAQALTENTEGWITGILLTSHLLWQGLVAKLIEARAADSPVFEYLAAEVLEQQPPTLQQFLLEAAVLPDMEAEACDAVLGQVNSAGLLKQALARRLFINAIGDEAPTYQYHHLFRDFLLARLRARAPERLRELQTRAAQWFGEHGMPALAVTFYAQAGNLRAAALLADAEARRLYDQGRHVTLRRWAEQLAAAAELTPRLYLFLATADMDAGSLNQALVALDQAEAGFAADDHAANRVAVEVRRGMVLYRKGEYDQARARLETAAEHPEAAPTTRALAWRHLGNCLLAQGRPAEAEGALTRARDGWASAGDRFNLALTLVDLSGVYRIRGKSSLTAQAQQEALRILREAGASLPLVNLLNNIGWDMYMLGQYEAALATYHEALGWARRSGVGRLERPILEGQATVLADLGETVQSRQLYLDLLNQTSDVDERHILIYACCGLARVDRLMGNYTTALEWVRRAELHAQGYRALLPMTNTAGLRGIVLVEMGRIEEGLAELQLAVQIHEASEALTDLAATLFYLACAEQRAGHDEAAATALNRACDLAERVGYEQMLLREAPLAVDMLEALRQHPAAGARAEGLLARAGQMAAARARLAAQGVIGAEEAPAAPPAAGIEVRSLGGGRVFKDGVEIGRTAWGAQRARDLFFYLADRMPVAREVVLDIFWGEMPPARATANLYQTLYRVRKALNADVAVLDGDQIRPADELRLTHDAAEFELEALAALAMPSSEMRRLGTLDRAARRYGGDFLPELDINWADERRQALRELHLRVLTALADERMQYTQYAEARAVLERALAIEPLRDDLHSRMLICLAAMGWRHEVVAHYRRYRETLRTELGLDPPAEIRQLYDRLIE